MGEAEIPPPHPLLPTACRYAGPAVIRTGELALSFTYCGTWETGQNSRADRPAPRKWEVQVSQPEGVNTGEPALPFVCSAVALMRERFPSLPLPSPPAVSGLDNIMRAELFPQLLGYLGEQTLHLICTSQ